VGVSKDNKWSK